MLDDIIFVIRKDEAKVARIKEYLSWKDVRKNAKEEEEVHVEEELRKKVVLQFE